MSDEYYRGVPIVDILEVAGLTPAMEDFYMRRDGIAGVLKAAGLNLDLTTTMGDPRNVAYIGPLENDDDEDMAEGMAAASYSDLCERYGDDDDTGYEQCLVDARRMLCDRNYARLFGGR
jgi:hypothetical protein